MALRRKVWVAGLGFWFVTHFPMIHGGDLKQIKTKGALMSDALLTCLGRRLLVSGGKQSSAGTESCQGR